MKKQSKVITSATGIAAAVAIAIAGASWASAADTPAPTSTSSAGAQGQAPLGQPGQPGQGGQPGDPSKATHPGEVLLTGTTKDKVTAAAKAKESGATIERVESDAEGVYEAHMVRADGTHVTVHVGKDFSVTSTQVQGAGR